MDAKHVPSLKAFSAQKMQKVNVFETERMFCDIYCFEPGQEQKTHTHDGSDKIYYVLEGSGTFDIGGERIPSFLVEKVQLLFPALRCAALKS